MTKDMMMKIMLADGCTKSEAERFYKNDSIIWEDYEDFKASCIAGLLEEDEIPTLEDIKARKAEGMSFVTFEGQDYIIEYTL